MVWNLTGQLVETCSCNMLCPCWFGVKELMVMDQGWCASTFLFRIQQGSSDGVNLGGRTVVLATDFPGPTLLDGNGTARIYVDAPTTDDQRHELESIFQGRKGGPMEVLAGLLTRWLPTQGANIQIQEEDDALTATVGEFGQVKSQRLKNEAGQPMRMQNVGFAAALQFRDQAADLAPGTGTGWFDPEMPRQFESKSGAVASFTWRGN
jgi:hypothetical protein